MVDRGAVIVLAIMSVIVVTMRVIAGVVMSFFIIVFIFVVVVMIVCVVAVTAIRTVQDVGPHPRGRHWAGNNAGAVGGILVDDLRAQGVPEHTLRLHHRCPA